MDSVFAWTCVVLVIWLGFVFDRAMKEIEQGVICKEKGGVYITEQKVCAKLEVIK